LRARRAGDVEVDSRLGQRAAKAGEAVWLPPLAPHTLENIGGTAIHVVTVEVKPRDAG
jgi:hypothetical protein